MSDLGNNFQSGATGKNHGDRLFTARDAISTSSNFFRRRHSLVFPRENCNPEANAAARGATKWTGNEKSTNAFCLFLISSDPTMNATEPQLFPRENLIPGKTDPHG